MFPPSIVVVADILLGFLVAIIVPLVPPICTLGSLLAFPPSTTLSFNDTLIVLLALSAVTSIFLSPAKFNVVVPVSVGFTAILFPPAVAVQPASTLSAVAFILLSKILAAVVKLSSLWI